MTLKTRLEIGADNASQMLSWSVYKFNNDTHWVESSRSEEIQEEKRIVEEEVSMTRNSLFYHSNKGLMKGS